MRRTNKNRNYHLRQLLSGALVFLLGMNILIAQDIHFSQYFRTPSTLNPGLTGLFEGSYRLAGIYRTQWAAVTVPYQTVNLSGDAHNFLRVKGLGLGVNMFYDQAGDGNLGTFNVNLSVGYSFKLSSDSVHTITPGVQAGFGRRQIDRDRLSWDNQYAGGVYNPSLGSGEQFESGYNYPVLNAGVVYRARWNRRKVLTAGIAVHNLIRPNNSFFADNVENLAIRFNVHATYDFRIADKWNLIPGVLYRQQQSYFEVLPGLNARYYLNDNPARYRALYFGAWTRARDAAYVFMGLDIDSWKFGLSYDVNYSKLQVASKNRGGFEVSVIYIFPVQLPKRKHFKTCPDYI